jgi:hypothetical protein
LGFVQNSHLRLQCQRIQTHPTPSTGLFNNAVSAEEVV